MHELLLFGQLPASRRKQVLNVLTGVTAMQPAPLFCKQIIFKPNRLPSKERPVHVGGAQDIQKQVRRDAQGDVFFLRAKGNLSSEQQADNEGLAKGTPDVHWTLEFRDIPEVVRQRPTTISRLMSDTPIATGDPVSFLSAMDYSPVTSFFQAGQRFTLSNVNIVMYRILESSNVDPSDVVDHWRRSTEAPLLDKSGSYIVEASIRVTDGSDVSIVNKAANELLKLKDTLRGVVELDVVDRLALDTRPK